MNKKFLIAVGIAGCVAAYAAKKDPVVMTINGVDVPKSEFEYLYHKNSRQQIEPQTIDEYAEMFSVYKMKVQDAIAEGLDTTESFKNEFQGYYRELAAPYMVDSAYVYTLAKEAYDRLGTEIDVSHIMLFKDRDMGANVAIRERMDSIAGALASGADFATLARELSQDRRSAANGGHMGYIKGMMYPYDFENAAYTLKPGQVSSTVESPMGYHLVKAGDSRKTKGSVLVKHLLRLVNEDAPADEQASVRNTVDSLYNALAAGADFDTMAKQYSQDPGSAQQGGLLPWFETGRMVPEFEDAAFTLAVGEISKPVKTQFGWHIIQKIDAKGLEPFETLKPRIMQFMSKEQGHQKHIYNQYVEKAKKRYNYKENSAIERELIDFVAKNGFDSLAYSKFTQEPLAQTPLINFADQKRTIGDFASTLRLYKNNNPKTALDFVKYRLDGYKKASVYAYAMSQLENEYPDFRNLINEYRDGMLMFEVSNRKVWDKAAQDTEGLEKYFENHRADYTWKAPHVKGYLIQASSDSVANAIKSTLANTPAEEIVSVVRKEFADDAKIDKVLKSKGENAMIDALAFGEGELQSPNSKYPVCFLYDFKILTEPQEAADVRGQVTSDYQNELEQQWLDDMKARYPVTINQKELKKIK